MTDRLRILVVDDNTTAADALTRLLKKGGDDVRALYDGASAIDAITADPPDVVLTDLKMIPVDGMQVLRAARAQRPPVDCIVFTAFGDVDIAVNAMRLGARDFLTKPVTAEQVASRLDQLRHRSEAPEAPAATPTSHSPASIRLDESLERASKVRSRVWIEGEVGSGRVDSARRIHAMSGDAGSFSIVDPGRPIEWPSEGTVVLPKVDDLPEDLQRNLSRQLSTIPEGLRVVATASDDGRRLVTEGSLRPELYYTLAVIVVSVPPLRARQEDIRPMFDAALTRFAERYRRSRPVPDAQTYEDIRRHSWPGNVRELLNAAERMVVMGADRAALVVVEPSGTGLPDLEPGFNLAQYLENTERRILEEALRVADGDRAVAGKILGVERNTLRYKLNKYGLLDR